MFIINFIKKLFYKVTSIFYVGATDMLPEPLSREMEDYYVGLKDDGDLKAKDILIEHNLRLVVFLAKKYENTGVDLEDLVSIGTIGLIKGINTFSKSKNIKLATYASRCIDNEILMYLRKKARMKNEVSLDEPLNRDKEGNELLIADILATDENEINKELYDEETRISLREEITKLKPREQEILSLRFGLDGKEELTQKEVAEFLGISQSYISRLEKKILKKLKVGLKY